MKVKSCLLLIFITFSSIAMQPMQWFRDAAPAVEQEMRNEAAEAAKLDADNATFELILLSRKFEDPVLTAIARRQVVQKVDRLLKRGANPNADHNDHLDSPSRPKPVISKAIPHFPEIVELLLQAGANPDSYGYSLQAMKDTILFKAIKHNNIRIVTLLLQYGANPNLKDELEDTPLLIAIEKKNPEIVRLLLQAGANPNIGKEKSRKISASIAKLKNLNTLLRRSNAPAILNSPPALALAQEKLNTARNQIDQQTYQEIIEMLEHPEKITRTGLQKLTSEQYKLIEPTLKEQ